MPRSWLFVGLAAFALASGCALVLGIDDGTPRDGGSDALIEAGPFDAAMDADAGADAAAAPICDIDAAFNPPTMVTTLDLTVQDAHGRLTSNELGIVFQSSRDGGLGGIDIWTATRPSIGNTWTNITPVGGVNTAAGDNDPSLTGDQLTIYLSRAGEIYRATRATVGSAFGTPALVPTLNSALSEFGAYALPDNSKVYFSSTRNSDAGVSALFVGVSNGDGGFAAPTAINGTALTTGDNRFVAITPDELVIYFVSDRAGTGTQGLHDVWVASRASNQVAFGAPHVVPEVSSASDDQVDWISADRCRLYLTSNKSGTYELYAATKVP